MKSVEHEFATVSENGLQVMNRRKKVLYSFKICEKLRKRVKTRQNSAKLGKTRQNSCKLGKTRNSVIELFVKIKSWRSTEFLMDGFIVWISLPTKYNATSVFIVVATFGISFNLLYPTASASSRGGTLTRPQMITKMRKRDKPRIHLTMH